MAFRIQDLTIQLSIEKPPDDAKGQGPPCTMMSGEPERCQAVSLRPCRGRGSEKPKQDRPGDPGEQKGLAFLQAWLRESLASPV